MKFKKGDRVYWRDGVVGDAVGTVKAAWIDSRIGEALCVERDGHEGERYPVDVAGDGASKEPLSKEMSMDNVIPQDVSKEKLVELADAHIRLYMSRVDAGRRGARGINLPECEAYLSLWRGTRATLLADEELSARQLDEIQDAIDCGDYDELLGLEPEPDTNEAAF